MPKITRPSGITVETNGVAAMAGDQVGGAQPGALPPPAVIGRRRRAGRRAADVAEIASPDEEWKAINSALAAHALDLVDTIQLHTEGPPPPPLAVRRRRRRLAGEPSDAALIGAVDVGVPLGTDEHAVVLLLQDGVYSWHIASAHEAVSAAKPAQRATKRRGTRAAAAPPAGRIAHFRLELAPPGRTRKRGQGRRSGLLKAIFGKAVAYVLRFVAKPVLNKAAKWLERDVDEGLVLINDTDPSKWKRLTEGDTVAVPAGGPSRVLLLVHGTFSSTLGSFGALGAFDEGRAFLSAAFEHYDLVIGWDHRTLSVTPDVNALAILDWLQAQDWKKPPTIDAIAFSRGGLVLRALVEELMPQSKKKFPVKRAVFVGCTNGGTELARPANWHHFADTYMNLAAAGARALGLIPGFQVGGEILSATIRGLGGLLKTLAVAAVDDNAIPGLAAMNPAGKFVIDINTENPGQPSPEQVYYCAITSNFDPDTAQDDSDSRVMPPGLLLKLFDKGADALHGEPNDLVVHVAGMTQIDPDVGAYIRERLDYGTNGTVHHCFYFHEPRTADALQRWLPEAS